MRGVHGRLRARWAHLLAEKNFSDAHVVRKMIGIFRACGHELCEAFGPWLTMMLVKI